jgi:hypothetical protein
MCNVRRADRRLLPARTGCVHIVLPHGLVSGLLARSRELRRLGPAALHRCLRNVLSADLQRGLRSGVLWVLVRLLDVCVVRPGLFDLFFVQPLQLVFLVQSL